MKLKNKKTGEIGDIAQTSNNAIIVYYPIVDGVAINPQHRAIYESLVELNMEWEDYEEPKEYWYMDYGGRIKAINDANDKEDVARKEIGNYFETREEAEKAVDKLKAWKRLKDKGFRFTLTPGVGPLDVNPCKFNIEINADMPEKWFCCDAVQEDLDDCFGGEE